MPHRHSGSPDRALITSVVRAFNVLEAFKHGKTTMRLQDVSDTLGMPVSSLQRYMHTLVMLGYLSRHPRTKAYSLTPRTLEIGASFLESSGLSKIAYPYLHRLNQVTTETCALGIFDQQDVIYISRFASYRLSYINMPVGTRVPMYCSASGRAILSKMSTERQHDILDQSNLTAYTNTTITDAVELLELISAAKQDGYAWAFGEFYPADINLGAAITDQAGMPIGAVNLSVPTSRYTLNEARRKLAPFVIETARDISASIPAS